ncbi:MAG: hypothetical protein J6Q68_04410 [Clostridia bacterium]|nr:hypothetical protein [Clostridia bacterium]
MNKTTLSLGSVTYAMKAKRILLDMKIHSKLIKLDSGTRDLGCIYGLAIASDDYKNAVMGLKKEGITFSVYS